MTYGSASQKCILLVDDEPGLQITLGLLMESEGFRVLIASNGLEGLSILETNQPDLIITDFMMPQMDGLKFIAEIRANASLRDIPIVLTSAVDVAVPKHPGGDITFLHKPARWMEMKACIQRLLP